MSFKMSKRVGGKYRMVKNENYESNNDITVTNRNNKRCVNFKWSTRIDKKKFRWVNPNLLSRNDTSKGAFDRQSQYQKSLQPVRFNQGLPKKFVPGALPWYRITIPYGAKHTKDVILKALLSFISPEIFIPQYYEIIGNSAVFYIKDVKIAEKLFYSYKKITMCDGYKLIVIVKNAVPIVTVVNDEMKQKMKLTMAKRYNPVNKALDLTKFHADPDLSDIFCELSRPKIMMAVIDIIVENIPDLEALNLNNNKMHGIQHLKVLSTKLKNLKILYLGNNKIPAIGALDALKSLPLVELYLKGNPLLDKFQKHELYTSEMLKMFPTLMRLDGVNLQPLTQTHETPLQQEDFAREFLTQYYAMYDSISREQLLDAYHEQATVSVTCVGTSARENVGTGRTQVVSILQDLPRTQHDLMGFHVVFDVFTPTSIVLTVRGTYKESDPSGVLQPLHSFQRKFVVAPKSGGGFCITNDTLLIINTEDQEQKAFPSGVVSNGPTSTPTPVPTDKQLALLTAVEQQTGMNQCWSINCLDATGWDLEKALTIFEKLNLEGKIPPEAFAK